MRAANFPQKAAEDVALSFASAKLATANTLAVFMLLSEPYGIRNVSKRRPSTMNWLAHARAAFASSPSAAPSAGGGRHGCKPIIQGTIQVVAQQHRSRADAEGAAGGGLGWANFPAKHEDTSSVYLRASEAQKHKHNYITLQTYSPAPTAAQAVHTRRSCSVSSRICFRCAWYTSPARPQWLLSAAAFAAHSVTSTGEYM